MLGFEDLSSHFNITIVVVVVVFIINIIIGI